MNTNPHRNDLGYVSYNYPESREISGYEKGPISFQAILGATLKRPWVVITTILLVLVPVIYYIYNQTNFYESSAYISLPLSKGGVAARTAESYLFSEGADVEEYFLSLLDSRDYKDDIAENLLTQVQDVHLDSLKRIVREGFSFSKKPRTTGFVNISGKSESPQLSYMIAVQALNSLDRIITEQRRQDAYFVVEYVEKILQDLNQDLEDIEVEIQKFLEERNLRIFDVQDDEKSEIRILEQNLAEAETHRDMIKLQLDNYNNLILRHLDDIFEGDTDDSSLLLAQRKRDQLSNLNQLISDSLAAHTDTVSFQHLLQQRRELIAELVNLSTSRSRFRDEPDGQVMRISVRTLEAQLQQLMMEYENAQIRFKYFANQIESFNARHPNLSNDILEFRNINRTRDVIRRTIDILVEKRESARIGTASEGGGIRVIDNPRLPVNPVSTKSAQKMAIALVLAIGMGLGVAFVIDYFDTTVQSESDITDRFGISVFGSVPVLNLRMWKGRGRKSMQEELDKKPEANLTLLNYHTEASPVAEAYRSLRTAIQFASQEKNQKTFVISSSVAAEGKTLTTHNLGVSFAQYGMRVLLVDADLRRASMHKITGIDREPGLTNYLHGECSLEETYRDTGVKNLTIIPAGGRVNNPADLLSSNRMAEFIKECEGLFDIVLIDTPPISPCTDSRNLASIVGGMILVVRAEMTKLPILEHCVNLCNKVNVKIQGVIINHVTFRYSYGYYYIYQRNNPYGYYYYYSGYSYYYTQDPETGERAKSRTKKKRKHRQKETV